MQKAFNQDTNKIMIASLSKITQRIIDYCLNSESSTHAPVHMNDWNVHYIKDRNLI